MAPTTPVPTTSDPAPGPDAPGGPPPDPTAVEVVMARLAAGDTAAVFTLAEHHGSRIAGVVRRHLRHCGVDRIAPEDLDGLVIDSCLALADVAGAWRHGGALPWWWASGRILGVVAEWVGVHADALDDRFDLEEARTAPAPTDDEDIAATFARLVDEVPIVGLVAEACRVARVEEAALFCLLEYRIQKDQGDPSPAHTLAPRYGVTPEALRQRVSRNTRRLRRVVAAEPRFAPLADFVLVA